MPRRSKDLELDPELGGCQRTAVDVGEMHLDDRQSDGEDRVANGDAGRRAQNVPLRGNARTSATTTGPAPRS